MGYVDLSSAFVYKDVLFQSKLDQLAENDNVLRARSIPDGTKVIFFQASVPTGYTQDTGNNGNALRVVSGAGGGTAGSFDLSTTITLAHSSHSISDEQHDHEGSTHIHFGDFVNISTDLTGTDDYAFVNPPSNSVNDRADAGASTFDVLSARLVATTTGAFADNTIQNHGGSTSTSALSDVTFQTMNVIIGTKNAATGAFTDLSTEFDYFDKINFDPFQTLNTNDLFLEEALIRSGTVCFFPQSSEVTGWSLDSGATFANALRVVSGAGGAEAGSKQITTSLSLAHTIHTVSTDTTHNHNIDAHVHDWDTESKTDVGATGTDLYRIAGDGTLERYASSGSNNTVVNGQTQSDGSGGTTGSDGSHTHTLGASGLSDITLRTLSTHQASKDSGGGGSFTDLTSSLVFKKLVSKQRLNALGANDKFVEFHQIPASTKMVFFQAAAPTGWTQDTSVVDALLSSSDTAFSGLNGSFSPVATITIAHTHSLATGGSHTHAIPTHIHNLSTRTAATGASQGEFLMRGGSGGGGSTTLALRNKALPTTGSAQPFQKNSFSTISGGTTNSDDHNHGGATGSLLSDITIATQDVIRCTKN